MPQYCMVERAILATAKSRLALQSAGKTAKLSKLALQQIHCLLLPFSVPMSTSESISLWIDNLKQGNSEAAQRLWESYAMELVKLAQRRLKNSPKRVADEEDVAASVFRSLCRGAAAGRFENVKNRDHLWWLLLAITKQKVADHIRREMAQKRGASRVQSESTFRTNTEGSERFTLDRLIGDEPTPEFILMLEEQHQRLLALLRDDRLRQIAIFRIEGFTIPEIADGLRISTRSIERKLRLIRGVWARELGP